MAFLSIFPQEGLHGGISLLERQGCHVTCHLLSTSCIWPLPGCSAPLGKVSCLSYVMRAFALDEVNDFYTSWNLCQCLWARSFQYCKGSEILNSRGSLRWLPGVNTFLREGWTNWDLTQGIHPTPVPIFQVTHTLSDFPLMVKVGCTVDSKRSVCRQTNRSEAANICFLCVKATHFEMV